ncbi:3'-5' exonuclease-like [Henckelia pumila]|uniref:3'-5' exonuclease-like n=1 Tax=Henckelia pumila TaxID=405737 RepID=UPI003C6E9845
MTNSCNVEFYDESIHTTVTDDPTTVSLWLRHTQFIHCRLLHLIAGLDVEWRPSFTSGGRYPVAVLQICVGRRCLIYQMLYSGYIPHSLARFIANPFITFVGVGVKEDLKKLERDYGLGNHAKFVDLRELAAYVYDRTELRQAGLKSLANVVLGKDMEKPKDVTLSRWDYRRLTTAQVRYACLDAFVSFEIGRILTASVLIT